MGRNVVLEAGRGAVRKHPTQSLLSDLQSPTEPLNGLNSTQYNSEKSLKACLHQSAPGQRWNLGVCGQV